MQYSHPFISEARSRTISINDRSNPDTVFRVCSISVSFAIPSGANL